MQPSGKRGNFVLLPIRVAALIFSFILAGRAQEPPADPANIPTKAEIDSVLRELSDITGFRVRKQLPFEMVTRDQVNRYLKEQIRHSVKPDDIRAEETTLRKFGFVAADFDLKKTTIELLTEQAAAYYDFHRKKLFISSWAAQNMRQAALVHELAHALADQNFPIRKYLGKGSEDSEESIARESVVEGQASWLMIEYAARHAGKSLADPQTAGEYLKADAGSDDDASYPVFSKAPLYLKRTLMFPYEEGEKFQQAVFLKDGKQAFATVFTKAPQTTSQIIHPDRYFGSVVFSNPPLPKPVRRAKAFVKGTVGELDHRILLRQYVDSATADDLGPKLKAAAYRIDEAKPDHRMMLIYSSNWDSEDSASKYFGAYQKILRGKWKSIQVAGSDATHFHGKSEDGYFSVALNGTIVSSEEGFENPL